MKTALILFNRDLRVHDNPALEHRQLAVDGGDRQRHPPQPRPQPRCARPNALIPTASTCVATCRSSNKSEVRRSSALGGWKASTGSTTRSRSSTTTRPQPPSRPGAKARAPCLSYAGDKYVRAGGIGRVRIALMGRLCGGARQQRPRPRRRRDSRRGGRARGGDRPAPRRRRRPYVRPTRSTTPPTCGRWRAGCDRVVGVGSVGSPARSCRLAACVCPDDFIASRSAPPSSTTPRAHIGAQLRPGAGAREVLEAWARRAATPARRRRILADARAALRDPGRDPPDGRPRRPGRDDDRRGVRRRRRARARVRGALRGRQPRQRPRRGAARPSRSSKPTASPTRRACATPGRGAAAARARSAGERRPDRHRRRARRRDGRAALRGRADRRDRRRRRRRARRRDDRRRRRAAGRRRWSTATPTRR